MSCHGNIILYRVALGVSCRTIKLPSFNGMGCKLVKIGYLYT